MADAEASDALLRAGAGLVDQVHAGLGRVSHLTFVPHLVVPAFRARVRGSIGEGLVGPSAALADLLSAVRRRPRPDVAGDRLPVVVLALVDGLTRVARTLPEQAERRIEHRGGRHGLLAVALERLVLELTEPHPTGGHT
jgi:hypothetical protein